MIHSVRVSQEKENRKGIPKRRIVVKCRTAQSVKGSLEYKMSSAKQGGAGNEAGETERRQCTKAHILLLRSLGTCRNRTTVSEVTRLDLHFK